MGFFKRNPQKPNKAGVDVVDESLRQAPEWKPSNHELMIMITLSIISFMVSLDACIIVTSLSAIVQDLKATATQGIWVGTAYLLSTAVAMPFLAAISDIFGRPILLFSSVVLFTIGSIVCATAPTIGQLLGGRSIQGIGGGGIVVLAMVIFTDIVPLRYRPKWYGTVQGAWALGNCIGPVLGGIIAQKTTWRWVFYVMLPFCGFGLAVVPFLLTIKPRVETVGQKLARVDWVGSFIFIGSATSFLVAISWGGSQFEWASVQTIAPLVLGIIGLAGTAAWERFVANEPLMRHSLFHNVSAVVTFICSAIQGLVLFGQLYYGPMYFLSVLEYSPINTGLALLPTMLTLVPASIITGLLVTRFNCYLWPIWAGWVIEVVACIMMQFWDANTTVAYWVVTLVVLGLGHGSILNAQNFATQAIALEGDEANAAAMYAFLRHFGTALGVGIGGTTFQNVMSLKLSWLGLPTTIAKNAEAFIAILVAMPASPQKTDIVDSYVYGFRGVYRVYLGISAFALILSLFIKHFDMNKALVTEHKLQDNRLSRIVDARLANSGAAGGGNHANSRATRMNGATMLGSLPEEDGDEHGVNHAKLYSTTSSPNYSSSTVAASSSSSSHQDTASSSEASSPALDVPRHAGLPSVGHAPSPSRNYRSSADGGT